MKRLHQVAFCLVLAISSNGFTKEVCLKHDDGSQESKKSMTGGTHAVLFDCPDDEQWYITRIAVHGSRYGAQRAPRDNFSVVVANKDLDKIAPLEKPYKLFKRGDPKWVQFDIPAVRVPKKFQVMVSFNPTRTKGVYVGIDQDSTPTHSSVVFPDASENSKSGIEGDWMIRAYVTKEPKQDAIGLRSPDEVAAESAKLDAESDAKLLGDARSITLSHDKGKMDKHINVQGACYTMEFETPKNVEAYVWQVQMFASQFGRSHDSEAVSGDVYILNSDREIVSRTSFPYSLTSQKKQWVNIPTLPTRVKGKFYVSINTHGKNDKGIYLGYQNAEEPDLASADELKENTIEPSEWSSKFDKMRWMIRAKVADRPVVY